MQSRNGAKILVVTANRQDPERVRNLFYDHGAGKDIVYARSYMGALEMARREHPDVCILSQQMVTVEGRSFADALKQACPETEIFIAEDGDFTNGKAGAAVHGN